MSRPATTHDASDAILTLPNIITFVRLGLVPVFVWLGVGAKQTVAAFVVGGIAGSTDFIDGKVARRMGQVSKLGAALDPFVDRLLIAGAAIMLVARDFAPLWAVLVVVLRDVLVVAAVPFLVAKGAGRPPVSWWGKAATMGIMWGFGLWIGAHMTRPPLGWLELVGWICYVPGTILSYYAAFDYAREARRRLRPSVETVG